MTQEKTTPLRERMIEDMRKAITETSFRTLNDRAAKLAQSVIDKMSELQERQVA